LIGPSLNNNEITEAPQNIVLFWSIEFLPFGYIGERKTTFAKAYGIKVRCNEENIWEKIGKIWGT
jgi:hypothetical protein